MVQHFQKETGEEQMNVVTIFGYTQKNLLINYLAFIKKGIKKHHMSKLTSQKLQNAANISDNGHSLTLETETAEIKSIRFHKNQYPLVQLLSCKNALALMWHSINLWTIVCCHVYILSS